MCFKDNLVVAVYSEDKWRLYEKITYECGRMPNVPVITVPRDFITDFASVPGIFHSILAPIGKYTEATVLHDYLYSKVSDLPLNRKQCDKIFWQAMICSGVSIWQRFLLYTAVRLFGCFRYKRN